jgi:hypothetical protein
MSVNSVSSDRLNCLRPGVLVVCVLLVAGLVERATAQSAPAITANPTNQILLADETASFRATVSGTSPFRYEWRFMENPIPGASNAVLTLVNAQLSNTGPYRVVVSNDYGAATSAVAVLVIRPTPGFAFVSHAGNGSSNQGNGIVVDGAGDIYVTGQFTNVLNLGSTNLVSAGGMDAFMAKYGRDGHLKWAKQVGGVTNDSGTGVAVDPFGNIYFSGSVTGLTTFDGLTWTNAAAKSYMAKYDSSGSLLWVKTNPAAAHFAFDPGGNAYSSGTSFGSSGSILFLDKYDPEGMLVSRRWITSATPCSCYGRGITAIDSATNVYVAAMFGDTLTLTNTTAGPLRFRSDLPWRYMAMILKFNPAGQAVWGKQFGGCWECTHDDVFRAGVDADDNVYLSGAVGESTMSFLVKYDSNGSSNWIRHFGHHIWDFAISAKTNILIGGNFPFGAFPLHQGEIRQDGLLMRGAGGYDAFVARLDAKGQVVEAKRAGGIDDDSVLALAVDKAGNAYVTGYFRGSANFGPENLTSSGAQDFFVARLQTSVPALNSTRTAGEVKLSWDGLADGFVLESTEDLVSPFGATGLTVQSNNSEFFAVEPLSEAKRFYRLRRP